MDQGEDSMPKLTPVSHSSRRPCRRSPLDRTLYRSALLALAAVALANSAEATRAPVAPELPAVREAFAGLAVPFEQNTGQFEPEVAYLARTFAGSVFVTRDGRLVYSLPGKAIEPAGDDAATESRLARRQRPAERGPGWALEERLLDARPLAPRGTVPAVTHVTRFTPKGTFQAETWQGVRLGEAWAGIEVELAARGRNFEKLFHVAAGADPERIQIGLRGAEGVHIAADGRLIVATGNGEVAYTAPVAWQEIEGERQPVEVRYALLAPEAGAAEAAYGFSLGAYDRDYPLTIDPLIQSTYLGGSDSDQIESLAVAANGEVLVAGWTESVDLPGTVSGYQPNLHDFRDGFVARLSGDLTSLRQITYLGGDSQDEIRALALATNGDVLVGGWTTATDFPGTAGGAQPTNGGGVWDGFVARLSGDLTTLRQSTYLGGSNGDNVYALTLTASGDLLVGGETSSVDLPGSAGGAQPSCGGLSDGFVALLSGDLRTLHQSTYFGGSGWDWTSNLVLAANDDVLAGGGTNSTDLPSTAGGVQVTHGGGSFDGFVARLSGDLRTMLQSTYFGGSSDDGIRALALTAGGNLLMGGQTDSADLPGSEGGAQPSNGGFSDGFVALLSGDLRTLLQSTYFGGSGGDGIRALALAADGEVLVGGGTDSADLPGSANGAQATIGGLRSDGFVARFSGDLQTLLQSTYLGGSGWDEITTMAMIDGGDLLVGGVTWSADLPGTAGGAQPVYGGGLWDGFVARLTGDLGDGIPVVPPDPCVPSATKLCLNGGRFHVAVRWRDYSGTSGDGQAEVETDDAGLFWFFTPTNLEMLVKVLDGCGINGHYWVFAAATTDVEYELTVRDSLTHESRTWRNPLGVASPAITDTAALAVCP